MPVACPPRAQVKQGRTASSYEFKVLRINDWMVEQEYTPFCRVVEVSPKRYRVEVLADDGVPRVPSVEAVIEFFIRKLKNERFSSLKNHINRGRPRGSCNRQGRRNNWGASCGHGSSHGSKCLKRPREALKTSSRLRQRRVGLCNEASDVASLP